MCIKGRVKDDLYRKGTVQDYTSDADGLTYTYLPHPFINGHGLNTGICLASTSYILKIR